MLKGVGNKTDVVSSFVSRLNEHVEDIGVIIGNKANEVPKGEEERQLEGLKAWCRILFTSAHFLLRVACVTVFTIFIQIIGLCDVSFLVVSSGPFKGPRQTGKFLTNL